jgi:hypothetical protein
MSGRPRGRLAIVRHTPMPYVEGFGTWPVTTPRPRDPAFHPALG